MAYGRRFILLPDIHRGRLPFRKAVSAGSGWISLSVYPRAMACHHFPFHIQPFFQFVISEENIAGPQRPDIPRRRFQAHILDRRAHRLDVRHFHQMLVYGKFTVVVLPLAVDEEDDDRRLFQHAGRINRGGYIFLHTLSENRSALSLRFLLIPSFSARTTSFRAVSADDHKAPGLLIMLRRRPGGCFQKRMQIFLRDVLFDETPCAAARCYFMYHVSNFLFLLHILLH